MKSILIISFMFLMASCQTAKQITIEQCSPFIAVEEAEVIVDGAPVVKSIVSIEKSACNCRSYFYGRNKIGPTSSVTRKDLSYCQGLIGNPPKEYATLSTFLETVRQDIIQQGEE